MSSVRCGHPSFLKPMKPVRIHLDAHAHSIPNTICRASCNALDHMPRIEPADLRVLCQPNAPTAFLQAFAQG